MFEISRSDQERLLRLAAVNIANLAVEAIMATEPFKSSLRPTLEIQPALRAAPKPRKRKPRRRKKTT